jgi:hypothetical protein
MLLPVPVVGQEAGPQYAIDIDNCLSLIDTHDHSPGKGVQITNAGLNITAALTINSNSLINARSVLFTPQTLFTSPSDNGSIFEAANGDLYYRGAIGAGAGTNIQLTSGSTIAGAPGSISGLVSPASASYNAGSSTFVFQSNTNTAANIDGGSFILRDITSGSNGITISPPSGLAANYTITLPSAAPSLSPSFLVENTAGVMSYVSTDSTASTGTTLQVASGVLQVSPGGIQLANMAVNSVGTSNLVNNSVTPAKLSSANAITSASCGAFSTSSNSYVGVTNLSVTIVTSGRPVLLMLRPDNNGTNQSSVMAFTGYGRLRFVLYGSGIAEQSIPTTASNVNSYSGLPPSAYSFIDFQAAGTYTYAVQVVSQGAGQMNVDFCTLLAMEI